jgi:hypothetical protein
VPSAKTCLDRPALRYPGTLKTRPVFWLRFSALVSCIGRTARYRFGEVIVTKPELPPALWDTAFEPYAKAIGYLVREWNDLQEVLCNLFGAVLDNTNNRSARAIWYAIQNDRLQRRVLLAAADERFGSDSAIFKEIKWLVEKADGTGQQRDDAVHSPVAIMVSDPPEFVSRFFFGHPRAKTLKGKKLLDEFELYRKKIVALRKYATKLDGYVWAMSGPERPSLPKRPELPFAPQKKPQAISTSRKS